MDELERDISPLQFLASNFEKQKSYSKFGEVKKKPGFFFHYVNKQAIVL